MTPTLLVSAEPLAHLGLVVLLAVACLVGGGAMMLRGWPGYRHVVLVGALLAMLASGMILTGPGPGGPPTPAAAKGVSPRPSLRVVQTSTMVGLGPDQEPLPISGRLDNTGQDSTYVAFVDVEITSVTAAVTRPQGACTAGDYLLTSSRMAVGRTLPPGSSMAFTGAAIGFGATARNQDACQGATVHLLYTARPG